MKNDRDIYNFGGRISLFSSNRNLNSAENFSITSNTTLALSAIQNENIGPLDTIYLDNFINLHVINSNISVFNLNCTTYENIDLSNQNNDDVHMSNRWRSEISSHLPSISLTLGSTLFPLLEVSTLSALISDIEASLSGIESLPGYALHLHSGLSLRISNFASIKNITY